MSLVGRGPAVVRCRHLSICAMWACPWAKNLSCLVSAGSRLDRTGRQNTTLLLAGGGRAEGTQQNKGLLHRLSGVQTLRNVYLWNRWAHFLHSKFFGIVLTCSWTPLWSLAYLIHIGVPMDQTTYIWNCWMDYLHLKFYGIASTCSCAASYHLPIWHICIATHSTHMGLPFGENMNLWNRWVDFSIRGSRELSRFAVVQRLKFAHICPFAPHGLALGPEYISLKQLNGFSRFKVPWNCLNLYLWSTMVICPFCPNGLSHGSECISHMMCFL